MTAEQTRAATRAWCTLISGENPGFRLRVVLAALGLQYRVETVDLFPVKQPTTQPVIRIQSFLIARVPLLWAAARALQQVAWSFSFRRPTDSTTTTRTTSTTLVPDGTRLPPSRASASELDVAAHGWPPIQLTFPDGVCGRTRVTLHLHLSGPDLP